MKKDEAFRSIDAERAILSGIVKYGGDVFVDVDDLISPDQFKAGENNALLYKCMKYHFDSYGLESKLDIPSIISAAKSLNLDENISNVDGMRYMRAIFNYPIEKETVRREAKKLFKLNLVEQLDEIAAQSRRDLRTLTGDESLNQITSVVETPFFDFIARLNDSTNEGPTHIAEGIDEFLDNIEANPRDNIGISSGFAKYDFYIGGGFRRGTLSIVGARMKCGKTILCDNIALHVAGKLNMPVLNLDTEMSREEHLARVLAFVCGTRFNVNVGIREVETGHYASDPQKRTAVRKSAEWLKGIPYEYESVVNKSFEEQIASMRRWMRKRVGVDLHGVPKDALIIYDYLQPPADGEFNANLKEYQVLGYQTLALIQTAARCSVPIFSLVQLNRDGIDNESTAASADSDRILRKAANFSILKWKSQEEIAEDGKQHGTHKLVPIIARHGEAMSGGNYISLNFDRYTATITEGLTRDEINEAKANSKPTALIVED